MAPYINLHPTEKKIHRIVRFLKMCTHSKSYILEDNYTTLGFLDEPRSQCVHSDC